MVMLQGLHIATRGLWPSGFVFSASFVTHPCLCPPSFLYSPCLVHTTIWCWNPIHDHTTRPTHRNERLKALSFHILSPLRRRHSLVSLSLIYSSCLMPTFCPLLTLYPLLLCLHLTCM